jgi:hypothetical protein
VKPGILFLAKKNTFMSLEDMKSILQKINIFSVLYVTPHRVHLVSVMPLTVFVSKMARSGKGKSRKRHLAN